MGKETSSSSETESVRKCCYCNTRSTPCWRTVNGRTCCNRCGLRHRRREATRATLPRLEIQDIMGKKPVTFPLRMLGPPMGIKRGPCATCKSDPFSIETSDRLCLLCVWTAHLFWSGSLIPVEYTTSELVFGRPVAGPVAGSVAGPVAELLTIDPSELNNPGELEI